MDEHGIQLADQQREEHEVELILGALPSLWHNTQNVLRDLGYQQAPAPEADDGPQLGQPNDGPAAWRSDDKTAAAATSPSGSDDDGDEKVCRMCFSSEAELADDGSSLGRLIRPCYCDGSMRYVHDTCLDQWRRKAEASEAARVCGQCHARYRFRRRPHANLMAFVQASQMLRILVCVLAIFILSVAFGMVALLSLKTVALLGSTPLGFVRDAALRRVHVNSMPWNITLQPDKARAEVWIPAETWKHSASTGGMPRLDEEFYSKIDLEVFCARSPGAAAQPSLLEARAASAFVVSRQLHNRCHDRQSQTSFGRGRIRGTRAHLARSSALSFESNKTLSERSRRSAGWSTSLLARARARKCQYLLADLANALQPHAFAAGAPRWQRLQRVPAVVVVDRALGAAARIAAARVTSRAALVRQQGGRRRTHRVRRCRVRAGQVQSGQRGDHRPA
ncbi:hypothetical protein L1887_56673 [Cichorium endivia]|nr:hypothetical protein L1887_56673 [Cichorium endivia]